MAGSNVSPIDVQTYVEWELAKRQIPLNRMKRTEKDQEVQLSKYGNIQSLLSTFQANLTALTKTFNAVAYQATSSNPQAITAQVTSNTVAPVSHVINVTQLAQAESQISQGYASNNTALNLTDTLTVAVGTQNMGVTVAATDTLQNIRDNINTAAKAGNVGVTASIFATNVGGVPQYQLIVSSNQTGNVNAVAVTDSASLMGFTEQSKAQDAIFTVDKQAVDRPTNMITDVLDGLSFNLLSTSSGAGDVTLNISALDSATQNANIATAVQATLNSYNEVMSFLDKSQINPQTSNDTFPLIKLSLQNALSQTITGNGNFQTLASIGIVSMAAVPQTTTITVVDKTGKEVQKDVKYYSTGQLMLNADTNLPTLSQVLQDNPVAVQTLLTDPQNGIFSTVSSKLLDPLVGSISITIKKNVNIVEQRENIYKQHIADEELSLEKARDFYTNKYAALNVMLQKLQTTSDNISRQLDASVYKRT
jgi:flagellar hook-associated protein 2